MLNINDKYSMEDLSEVKNEVVEMVDRYKELINTYEPFNHTNLKLHGVSGYLYQLEQRNEITNEEAIIMFNSFCEEEYIFFSDKMKENNLIENYIGRTSSFYIDSMNYGDALEGFYEDYNGDVFDIIDDIEAEQIGHITFNIDEIEAFYNNDIKTIEDFYEIQDTIYKDFSDFMEELPDLIENIRDQVYFLNDEINDVRDALETIKQAYNELEQYKDNQVEIFKDYIEGC